MKTRTVHVGGIKLRVKVPYDEVIVSSLEYDDLKALVARGLVREVVRESTGTEWCRVKRHFVPCKTYLYYYFLVTGAP